MGFLLRCQAKAEEQKKYLPGVIALESQLLTFFVSSLTVWPIANQPQLAIITSAKYLPSHNAMSSCRLSSFSLASLADRKRRERCWFIFARGATPSIDCLGIRQDFGGNVPTDGHEKELSRPNHIYNSFRVDEDFQHHILFRFWGWFSFWVRTRVNLRN